MSMAINLCASLINNAHGTKMILIIELNHFFRDSSSRTIQPVDSRDNLLDTMSKNILERRHSLILVGEEGPTAIV